MGNNFNKKGVDIITTGALPRLSTVMVTFGLCQAGVALNFVFTIAASVLYYYYRAPLAWFVDVFVKNIVAVIVYTLLNIALFIWFFISTQRLREGTVCGGFPMQVVSFLLWYFSFYFQSLIAASVSGMLYIIIALSVIYVAQLVAWVFVIVVLRGGKLQAGFEIMYNLRRAAGVMLYAFVLANAIQLIVSKDVMDFNATYVVPLFLFVISAYISFLKILDVCRAKTVEDTNTAILKDVAAFLAAFLAAAYFVVYGFSSLILSSVDKISLSSVSVSSSNKEALKTERDGVSVGGANSRPFLMVEEEDPMVDMHTTRV